MIASLPPEDYEAFRAWFTEFDADDWNRHFAIDVARGRLDAETQQKLTRLRKLLESLEVLDDPDAFRSFVKSLDDVKHGRLVSQEEVEKEFL